jgi:hypothetical protein
MPLLHKDGERIKSLDSIPIKVIDSNSTNLIWLSITLFVAELGFLSLFPT